MPEYQDPVHYLGSQSTHQKIYDFERDILRVKNPLNDEFTFFFDGLPITIPAGGTKDMERYLVRRYIWNMIEKVLGDFIELAGKKALENFEKTRPDVLMDPFLENQHIWDKMKRKDDPELQKKVIKDCVVGLVSKFGSNRPLPKKATNGNLDVNTPLYSQLIDDFKVVDMGADLTINSQTPLMSTEAAQTAPADASEATIG